MIVSEMAMFRQPTQQFPSNIMATNMNPVIWVLLVLFGLLGYCVWRIWAQGLTWITVKRWLSTLALALLIISAFTGLFLYASYKRVPDEVPVKWMNILIAAAFVFGSAIKAFWQCRGRWAFWTELCVLAVAHCLILQRLHWQIGGYFWLPVIVGIPEIFVVFALLGLTLRAAPTPPSRSASH